MTIFLTVASNVFIILGALVFATAALGILRFPDAFTRISAVGTAAGLGIISVVVGAFLFQPTIPDAIKLVLIIALQLATSAVGSMAIARSAYLAGVTLSDPHYDELTDPQPSDDTPLPDREPSQPE